MTRILANLSLGRKFLLIGAIAALLLALPSAIVMNTELGRLAIERREAAGLAPAEATLRLVQLTQQHRGLAAQVLGGNAGAAPARAAKQSEVDRALADAAAKVATLGDAELAARAGRLAGDWQAVGAGLAAGSLDAAQSFAAQTALIANELETLQDIADASGISMHPGPAGHHLQQGVLAILPQLTELLGQMRARGALVLARGSATPEERAGVAALAAQARASFAQVRRSLGKAAAADPALGQALQAPLDAAGSAAADGLRMADQGIVRAETLELKPGDYFAAETRALDAQFALVDRALAALESDLRGNATTARERIATVGAALALLGALGAGLMVAVARGTRASIVQALRLAQAVADGDLGTRFEAHGRDEAGQLLGALARMNEQLRQVVGGVRRNADSVATASAQIAQGNQDLSGRTEQQAAALQQTAASMDELGSAVQQNAEHALQANELARSAAGVAREGGAVVARVVETMKSIDESSRRIAEITGVIDGIAFQTNILALNAAVEAARAGDQGRGFAVVAAEVRSLAQRAATAAREIKTLIGTSVERVEQGSALVDRAGSTMGEIVSAVLRVTAIMGEISAASGEQSHGVAQIGEAVAQLDRSTQQNSALVEESAAAAASLNQQARQLVEAVSTFRLGGAG